MPAGGEIQWSDEFALLDLDEEARALLALLGPTGPYYVLLRGAPDRFFLFRADELHRLPGIRKFRFVEMPPELRIREVFEPPEEEASRRTDLSGTPLDDDGPLPTTPGAPALASRDRWVAVDRVGVPVAVGEWLDRIPLGGGRRPPEVDLERFVPVGAAPPGAGEGGAPPAPESVDPAPPGERSTAPPGSPEAAAPSRDEGTDPVRHPSLELDREPASGAEVVLTVDLGREQEDPATDSRGVRIEGLEVDWTEVEVDVEVLSSGIRFVEPEGRIRVRRNADSTPAVFHGLVDGGMEPGESIRITAIFSFGGRDCGIARRSWTVEGGGTSEAPGARSIPLVVEREVEAPVLTVRILKPDPARPGRLLWSLVVPRADLVPGLPPRLTDTIDLGAEPGEFVANLYAAFAGVGVGAHLDVFRGFGDELWERTPPSFRKVYWALHAALGPDFSIQLVTDDPHIPWELMRPFDEESGTVGEILALSHPVARWIGVYEGSLRQRLSDGRVATIAPNYPSVMDELPRAREEAKLLTSLYGAVAVPGTLEGVQRLLRSGDPEPVGIVHFAGHGEFPAGLPAQSSIRLEDGSLSAMAVKTRETTLGERDGPLVVFNACKVGATGETLGASGGWADVFIERRFRGFLAPLWPVYDDDAALVVEELFEAIVTRRESVGEALRDIRARHAERSPTYLAYLYFGDVNARLPPRRS